MNKKQVVIVGAVLLIAALLIVISAYEFGIGGNSTPYDSYPGLSQKSDELLANSRDGGSADLSGNAVSFERKIISTAQLQLEVENVPSTINMITNITFQQGGFISGSSISGYDKSKTGQVTVRVPQKNFYTAIGQIESLGTVKSRNIQGEDVTEKYIDINARLNNLQKQEVRLTEILKMAITVKDVLEIEKELERVRGDIESLTGQINYLNQSIEMSTIKVNVNEPAPFFEEWGITTAFKDAINGFMNTISGLIVFTGYIVPIAIYLIVIILIGIGVKRKVMPRLFGKQ